MTAVRPAVPLLAVIVGAGLLTAPAEAQPAAEATAMPAPARFQDAPQAAEANARHAPGDPLEGLNRRFYAINQGLDRAIVRPLALGYAKIVPKPVRAGVRHFFTNLTEPIVFLNDLLQIQPKRAVGTLGRFVINTTLGLAGLIDVAKGEKLPHRSNGFGNTLGAYGVKAGPYLYLPILGPSDLRDLGGGAADGLVLPTLIGSPFNRTDYRIASTVLNGLDQRAEVDSELTTLTNSALDPYATLRSVYLQSRAAAIAALKDKDAAEVDGATDAGIGALDDPLIDPGAGSAGSPSSATDPASLEGATTAPRASEPAGRRDAAAPPTSPGAAEGGELPGATPPPDR
jgi:phospholipid-binding lipoprotein MlaA